MTDQLITHLADVIRRYTKNPYADGGRRPDGMKVLQRGRRRNIALKDVPKPWPEGSTVPEQVAPILLGIKFDKRKLVASMFDAAWEVARLLNLELTWEDDFKLGAFLISCLTKAGYYDIKDIYQFGDRIEYGLFAKKQAVKDFPASDPCTRFEPFPKWDSAIDADGWWLVKPSHPQLKRTFWQPEDRCFKYPKPTPEELAEIKNRKKLLAMSGVDVLQHWASQAKDLNVKPPEGGPIQLPDNFPDQMEHLMARVVYQDARVETGAVEWVRAINKLESNGYRINQRLLEVIDAVWEDENTRPPQDNPSLNREWQALQQEYRNQRRGYALVDGVPQFDWNDFSKENRYMEHLDHLNKKQKEQDKRRTDRGLDPYPPGHRRRFITTEQKKVRSDWWRRYLANQNAREEVEKKYKRFKSVLDHCNNVLTDKIFYQRGFFDYRGRLYLSRSVINYQGDDLQRAIIDFSEGKKVRKKDLNHLYTRLGDLYGIKGDKQQKEIGARQQKKKFLRWGKKPIDYYYEWSEYGDQWQLIRACIELAELDKNPNYKSTLICEIDESTSCLQHIAMLEGDMDLARRVNLTSHYNDIYQEIGDGMQELHDAGLSESDRRKLIKITLLAWTYGGDAWTACQDYHKSDMQYLVDMSASDRLSLANRVVREIEAALPSARRYRDDYKGLVDERLANTVFTNTHYETPSGFEVHGWKQETDERRVYVWQKKNPETYRDDSVRLAAYEPNESVDQNDLRKSMPPNFVHSIDASVIHKCLAATPDDQSLVAVHDAVGTHLRDLDDARERFRYNFWWIYAHHHPFLSVVQGDPLPHTEEYTKADGTPFLTTEFLEQIKSDSPHMI